MTKSLIVFAAFLSLASTVQAAESIRTQVDAEGEVVSEQKTLRIVPSIGVGGFKLQGSNGSSDSTIGTSVAGIAEFGSGYFSFQTGLMVNKFGGKGSTAGNSTDLAITYLGIPVMAKINLTGNATKTVYIKAGLVPSLVVQKELKFNVDGFSGTTSNVKMQNFDMPVVIGVGGAIPVSDNAALIVGIDYMQSTGNIAADTSRSQVKNVGYLVNAGLSIGL